MEFVKKLKIRLGIAVTYAVLGAVMIIVALLTKTDNNFVSAYGVALFVIGVARIKQYFIISKNEQSIKRREIAETDERNVDIVHKARSAAFIVYVIAMCLVTLVLSFLNMHDIAKWFAMSAMLLVVIYWVCYYIISKKF